MLMIPESWILVIVGLFGLVIGSFLNVLIYRFHTGRSLNDRSHCLSCGRTLSWYELFPVFSYVALRGRCSSCHSFIPYRYALVEIATASVFLLAYLNLQSWPLFFIECVFLSVLLVIFVYDLYHKIIPNELSITIALLATAIVGLEFLITKDLYALVGHLIAGLLPALGFYALWYFSAGRAIGLGDAKLSFGLGVLVGLGGLFSFIVLSFWLGALVGITLILSTKLSFGFKKAKARRVNMKSEIPFAPFLILSFLLVYFLEVNILNLFENVLLSIL